MVAVATPSVVAASPCNHAARGYTVIYRICMKANTQENAVMTLVRMLQGGQITLPAEARKALKLSEGNYLNLEVQGSTLLLKPVTVVDRAEADRQLDAILSRVKYAGPEPEPSEDKVMDMVVEEVRAASWGHIRQIDKVDRQLS